MLATTLGSCKTSSNATFNISNISSGGPAGADSPNHDELFNSGYPNSAYVGMSGILSKRPSAATAKGLAFPLFNALIDEGRLSNTTFTWPAIKSTSAGPNPL